ncbi:hypothetical protein KI659_17790 [Litoribacter alkaliphilus]|uniref:Outer membrane beta-barrel protein n=1 Tax=Litoribacter ruber TaxID=702568 RepID=A0AAP2G2J9_9BACT|nr:hypothetical protein [Litoribacter alkaliphilus]MBS9525877.1 hypothetical protein [Litoribacter alkaliphilus]
MKKSLLLALTSLFFWGHTVQAQHIRDHISVGIGPSFLYMDNEGGYKRLDFKLLPVFTIDYNRDISNHWDLRVTSGNQLIGTNGSLSPNSQRSQDWGSLGMPTYFSGSAFFVDFMPVYQFNPNLPDHDINLFNVYAGVGLGGMMVSRIDEIWVAEDLFRTERNTEPIAYIPARFGISSNTLTDWDVAAEWTSFIALSSRVDGVTDQRKRTYQDLMFQFQVKVKRYISR